MSDTFKKIKEELSVYYPGVTDDELETMTKKLIKYFTLSVKAVYEAKKAEKAANGDNGKFNFGKMKLPFGKKK